MDSKLKKWLEWLEIIKAEIQQLVIDKDIFWSVQRLIKNNKEIQKPSSFYQYLGDTYVSHSVIGVRRQIKNQKQSISFARLLTEIIENPEKISRKYYCGLYEGSIVADLADGHFDRYCIRPGDSYISSVIVENDLKELKQITKIVEEFSDRRIAHRDTRTPENLPKFSEIDASIELLDKLYGKYHLLLYADGMDSLLPTYQYDWQEIFDSKWRL